jgi:lysophospholipase L1-like esterase
MGGQMLRRKQPFYLGWLLLLAGIGLRWLIESALVADHRIEKISYVIAIGVVQLLAIAAGLFLVIRQPALKPPRLADLALAGTSLALTFVLLEVGARLWLNFIATPEQVDRFVLFSSLNPSGFAFTPHQYLSYAPTPGYHNGLTSHNSLGYRNVEIALQKPGGVYRIVAIGGSSTYDVRIEDNARTFTAQLEALLRSQYGHPNVEVINAGVPGYNSWEMLINLEFRVLDLDPDLVIIYEGTNDVHARMVAPGAYRGDNSGRRQPWTVPPVGLWEHSALLRILARSLNLTRQVSIDDFVSAPTYLSWPFEDRLDAEALDPAELLRQNPPIFLRRNLQNMIAVAEAHDVEVLLSTWAYSPNLNDYAAKDYYQQAFQENNEVVVDVAQSLDVPLFDFAAVMPQAAAYWADGRHVNETGAAEKAQLFAQFIENQGLITP